MKEDIYPLDDCFDWHIDTIGLGVEDRTRWVYDCLSHVRCIYTLK
jgi:hypothetical protein